VKSVVAGLVATVAGGLTALDLRGAVEGPTSSRPSFFPSARNGPARNVSTQTTEYGLVTPLLTATNKTFPNSYVLVPLGNT